MKKYPTGLPIKTDTDIFNIVECLDDHVIVAYLNNISGTLKYGEFLPMTEEEYYEEFMKSSYWYKGESNYNLILNGEFSFIIDSNSKLLLECGLNRYNNKAQLELISKYIKQINQAKNHQRSIKAIRTYYDI